jgi:simple sugar transport system ATP-binding protein
MRIDEPLIRLENISKAFGPVKANQDISLDIKKGTIKALLGENGAGKSTLMSILAGRYQSDEGVIYLNSRPVVFHSPKDAIACGIGMVYQHFMLVDAMTVAENVVLGQEPGALLRPKALEGLVENLAENYGLKVDPSCLVADLSMGEKQRVEILKLLLRESQVLIFDEPTTVLTPLETEQLFAALKKMKDQGKAIVFISHKLAEVMSIADEIAILKRGTIVDEMPISQVHSKKELAQRMVGREVLLQVQKDYVEPKQRVLKIESLNDEVLQQVSLDVRQGEILSVVGVAGNGQKQLVETVCGLREPKDGYVSILGEPWHRFHDRFLSIGALSYIPEDRQGLATCPGLDLLDNFLLTTRHTFSKGPWLFKRKAYRKTDQLVKDFSIHPPLIHVLARQLSGGNLQKMVLAREFFRRPRLIVAEQPTQGLDIGATEEIWELLLKSRDRAGVLLITGDLNEALSLADRIAVMYSGRIMDVFHASDHRKIEQIGVMMAGLQPSEA